MVVNRWTKQIDVQLQQVERFLGERVVGFVPNDYRAAVNSVNLGTPLVESTSHVSDCDGDQSAQSSRERQTADGEHKGILGSLFRRQAALRPDWI